MIIDAFELGVIFSAAASAIWAAFLFKEPGLATCSTAASTSTGALRAHAQRLAGCGEKG